MSRRPWVTMNFMKTPLSKAYNFHPALDGVIRTPRCFFPALKRSLYLSR